MKEFLKEIDGNAELLRLLDIDRLEKLSKYYDVLIQENLIKLNK